MLASRLRRAGALSLLVSLLAVAAHAADPAEIKVGVRGGPGQQIVEVACAVAARSGLKVVPVVIDGLVSPNEALNDGSLQANVFQHVAYLRGEMRNKGYKLEPTGYAVYNSPLAVYSVKYKSPADLPQGGRIAIPQDNANRSRALLALQDLGLLTLKPGVDEKKAPITVLDIEKNPKDLRFTELDVTLLPRTLADVDAGAVSATHALRVARIPLSGAIGVEAAARTKDYAIVLVVRPQDKDAPWVATFGKALQSPEVKAFIEKEFGTSLVSAF